MVDRCANICDALRFQLGRHISELASLKAHSARKEVKGAGHHEIFKRNIVPCERD